MPKETGRKLFLITFFSFFWLVVFDIGTNTLFRYPNDGKIVANSFQEYFDYGRSIEGKVDRMLSAIEKYSAPIALKGWLDPARLRQITIQGPAQGKLISVYGMSFAGNLADAMAQNGINRIRNVTVGGSPPTLAYATYLLDRKTVHSDVAIFTIMTLGVPYISATTGMTAFFEHPYPYVYPRYEMKNGGLVADYPPFLTRAEFHRTFRDPNAWSAYLDWLSKNDKYYSSILFTGTWADHSLFLRALRRAYFRTIIEPRTKQVYSNREFNLTSTEVSILRFIVEDFAKKARFDGVLPIVYLVNNQGCGDDLYQLLEPILKNNNIPFLSSHVICPPDDPNVFGTATHFTESKNRELAVAIERIIEMEFN